MATNKMIFKILGVSTKSIIIQLLHTRLLILSPKSSIDTDLLFHGHLCKLYFMYANYILYKLHIHGY